MSNFIPIRLRIVGIIAQVAVCALLCAQSQAESLDERFEHGEGRRLCSVAPPAYGGEVNAADSRDFNSGQTCGVGGCKDGFEGWGQNHRPAFLRAVGSRAVNQTGATKGRSDFNCRAMRSEVANNDALASISLANLHVDQFKALHAVNIKATRAANLVVTSEVVERVLCFDEAIFHLVWRVEDVDVGSQVRITNGLLDDLELFGGGLHGSIPLPLRATPTFPVGGLWPRASDVVILADRLMVSSVLNQNRRGFSQIPNPHDSRENAAFPAIARQSRRDCRRSTTRGHATKRRAWSMRHVRFWRLARHSPTINLLSICGVLILGGCNDKEKISNASMLVRASAVSSKGTAEDIESRARQIIGACAVQPPDVKFIEEQATAIANGAVFIGKEQGKIIGAATAIDTALPHVENKSGFWDSVWFYVKWTVIIGGGLMAWTFLERAGILPIIKKLFSWIPMLIPEPIQQKANLAVKALDPEQPEEATHLIAAMRSADPVFNAAFGRQKRLMEAAKGETLVKQAQEVVQA